jgi:hypothetical protein
MAEKIPRKDFINNDGINLSEALRSVGLIPTRGNILLLEDHYVSEGIIEEALQRTITDVEMQVENLMSSADN